MPHMMQQKIAKIIEFEIFLYINLVIDGTPRVTRSNIESINRFHKTHASCHASTQHGTSNDNNLYEYQYHLFNAFVLKSKSIPNNFIFPIN